MSTPASHDAPFLRDVVTQTTECIITVDQQGVIAFANAAVETTFGYDPAELVDRPIETLFQNADRPVLDTIHRVATSESSTDESWTERVTMTDRDGRPVTVFYSAKPVEHDGERYYTLTVQEAALVHQRVTSRVETDQLLQQVFEQSREALLVFDFAGEEVVDCNSAAYDLLGYSDRTALIGQSTSQLCRVDGRQFTDFVDRVTGTAASQTVELTCQTNADETIPVEMTASPVEVDGQRCVLATVRERDDSAERLVRKQAAALEASMDGIALLDDTGEFVYLNEALAAVYGYEDPDDLVGNTWRCLYGEAETRRFEQQILPETRRTGQWRGEAVGQRADGTRFPQELSLSTLEEGGLVCVVRDISDRRDDDGVGDDLLRELNEATRELMQAERSETIAQVALETIEQLFEYDIACVRLLDDGQNGLETIAATDTAMELTESWPACDLERTFAGQAYRTGETVIRSADSADTFAESLIAPSMHLPLGDYGVLTVASTATASFPPVDIEGAKMLAADVEAALDRAQRERELRTQTENLRQRHDQLDTINEINKLLHELISDLFQADSREAVEQQVCDRLTTSNLYESAWIGELSITGDGLSVTAANGTDEQQLKAADTLPIDGIANGIVERALDAGSVVSDRRYQVADSATADGEPTAMEATAAVPIQHGDRTFGVLVVDAIQEDAFETIDTESLDVLGDIIGFSLGAIQNRALLLSNETVQLEFEVTDPGCLAVAVTDELDCYCQIERTVRASDGTRLSYLQCEGVSAQRARDVTASTDGVLDCRVVSEWDDGCVLEAKRDSCGTDVMMEYGATMRRAQAEDGVGSLIIEAPKSSDPREIAKAYEQYNPESEIVAKREVERPVQTASEFRETIHNRLTDKQRSAITAAYFSGYYQWPRESTGEEIAASLGISSATLHQHLRSAHRELLDALLNDDSTTERIEQAAGD